MSDQRKVELLAPAGSVETMRACFKAGADAVYMGLHKFGARAYAENADSQSYLDAIDEAHLSGKKLYCTINTLLKDGELSELIPLVTPLYEAGLDGVIVQDLGVLSVLHQHFPELALHLSTQAAVTGPGAVRFLKQYGVTRVIPARELSLQEVRRIREETGVETEVFVHGALCYSYSGVCLFSSFAGGRSGNRGRCAGSCRLPYRVTDLNGKDISSPKEQYPLSMKDLNTIELLPEIIRSEVSSLKIEGRMKKTEYAAGVTSIYRKYLDKVLADPEAPYAVSKEDLRHLFRLFNREGFTEGFLKYTAPGSRVAVHEKGFRAEEEDFLRYIRENYMEQPLAVPVEACFRFRADRPAEFMLETSLDGRRCLGKAVSENCPAPAMKSPLLREQLTERLSKTGGSGFQIAKMDGSFEEGLFLPVSELNALRRHAIQNLKDNILRNYRRTLPDTGRDRS
ncbi:MAG: U32 family peptidase [Lachnospiraceae bacterium]|nr:U32 family peptidase [Lachnospiraceae bacterium]